MSSVSTVSSVARSAAAATARSAASASALAIASPALQPPSPHPPPPPHPTPTHAPPPSFGAGATPHTDLPRPPLEPLRHQERTATNSNQRHIACCRLHCIDPLLDHALGFAQDARAEQSIEVR